MYAETEAARPSATARRAAATCSSGRVIALLPSHTDYHTDDSLSAQAGLLRLMFTEEEATRLRADVQVLLDDEHPSDAISLLEAGLDRAVPGSVLELQMRRTLAAALLIGGQYSRAAQLFEQAGTAYRQHLGAADPWALDCAYQAGHAYHRPASRTRHSPSFATT